MASYTEVVSWVNQAAIALTALDYQSAVDAYTAALKLAQELDQPRLVAVLFNRLGQAMQANGNIQDAVIAYESGLRALEGSLDLNLELVSAQLSRASKSYAAPPSAYAINPPQPVPDLYSYKVEQTLEADENDPTLVVQLWLNIGNAYLQQPQENPALNAYEQALQRPEIEQNLTLKAYVLANIGEIDRRQNNIDAAEVNLNQALQLFEQSADPLEKRRALALLASIAHDRQQIDQAIDLYQQAIALYQQANDASGMSKTYAALASLYLKQQRYSEAEPMFQQALAIAETGQDQDTLWLVYWGLGCCQVQAGDGKGAIDSFEKSLRWINLRQDNLRTDEGKVAFLENVQEVFEKLLTVNLELAQAGEQDYQSALDVAERARGQVLNDLMQGRERWRHTLIDSQTEAETELTLTDEFSPTVPAFPDNMAVQSAVGIDSKPFNSISFHQDTDETEQPVPALLALTRLVFYCLGDRTAVFVATPDGQVKGHVVNIGDEAIAVRVTQLRQALQVDEVNRGVNLRKLMVPDEVEPNNLPKVDLDTLLQNLYSDFVAPVAESLPTDGSTVVIEPHCSLWLVPFAALKLTDGTWMGDRWPLIYAASLQTLEQIRQEVPYAPLTAAKLLAVGNPIMPTVTLPDGSQTALSPLPGAEAEVEAIAQLFPEANRTLLIQADATEANVKHLAESHNILHLATHGLAFGSDPLASLVAFSPTEQENGLLTAREVIQSAALPADLVVLSACQTGLGRITGEGMLGLSRSFLVAGARSVMVSQWSVSDSATMELMVAFYKHYFEHGNKAIALQQGMGEVRSQPRYSAPRYWAAFVVVGAEL